MVGGRRWRSGGLGGTRKLELQEKIGSSEVGIEMPRGAKLFSIKRVRAWELRVEKKV